MRNVLVLALVLASSAPAGAQPVASSCAVTIARAPDDVRIVVDAWVAAEPSCATALEVRIIPTEGGLYLLARDDQGRVRERIVPDAQSAGVLIASWAADDAHFIPPPAPVAVAPIAPVAPVVPIAGTPEPIPMQPLGAPPMPPGMTLVGEPMPPRDGIPASARPARISKWVSVAGLVGDGNDGGLRAEVDILTRGKWSFGAAASTSLAHTWVWAPSVGGELRTADRKLTATVTRNMQLGRFQLRAAAGLGVVYTHAAASLEPYDLNMTSAYQYVDASGVFPVADASVLLGVELGRNWALTAGPLLTVYAQNYQLESAQTSWDPPPTVTLSRRGVETMGYVGLRYRL